MKRQSILIVSESDVSNSLRDELKAHGFSVTTIRDCDRAYKKLAASAYALVMIELADASKGIDFIRRVRSAARLLHLPILVAADWGTGAATLALSQGADGYEPRPLDPRRIATSIERLLRMQTAVVK